MIDRAFLTSLAAALHVAGLQDEELSLVSQPLLDQEESDWVEGVAKCAADLDSYWGTGAAQQNPHPECDFEASPRFEDLHPIGYGGMGVVYSAFDKNAGQTVAIKVGKTGNGSSASIKREFRTLAKIRHPNLVVLKELHQFGGSVFFSMEHVTGERFNSKSVTQKTEEVPWLPDQISDLCDRLLELAGGIDFLHRNGYAHCDIKPSNILVTPSGRVVILDLGLAQSFRRQRRRQAQRYGGTSAYMSPEQVSGEPPCATNDWYSFGIVMFETLFGHRPFQGDPLDVLFDKLAGKVAVPPRAETGVGESLSDLCLGLLHPDPAKRPDVEEIRQCLERFSKSSAKPIRTRAAQVGFFGREQELAMLSRCVDHSVNSTEPALMLVEGASGLGKTYLVQKFLEDLRSSSQNIVLSGRCYENERIPYKAIDAVVGELATRWRWYEQPGEVSDQQIRSINAVFKGFSCTVAEADSGRDAPSFPQTPEEGLRAILKALSSDGKNIIIFIDDVQWADPDSGEFLRKMIRGIPITVICSHRRLQQPNQFLTHLTNNLPDSRDDEKNLRRIEVGPFSADDAQQFLKRNFPSLSKQLLAKAIEASDGVPMFLAALAEQLCAMPEEQIESGSLDWTRDLGPKAKRLLRFICAAGYPLPQSIALEAAQIAQDFEANVSDLSSRRLVTLSQSNNEVVLTPFHDMIRETIYSKLNSVEKKAVHSSIATISEHKLGVPPDRLAFHFGEAGDSVKCCRYSIIAGDIAAQSHAFGEAVRAYQVALDNFRGTKEEQHELKQKLASSLAGLGHASDAGDMYLELASDGEGGAPEFLQKAACQYCFAGRIEDALDGFDRLLKPWGYTTFQSKASVLWRLMLLRFKLKVSEFVSSVNRSLAFTRTRGNRTRGKAPQGANVSTSGVPDKADDNVIACDPLSSNSDSGEVVKDTQLCDLLWDTGVAMSTFDNVQAALFISYSLQVAIGQNDEVRTLRAKILWATHETVLGSCKEKYLRELLNSMDTDTTKNDAYLAGMLLKARGFLATCNGLWEEAELYFSEADEHFREKCADAHEEIGAIELWSLMALQYSGQVKSTIARYQELLASPANREHFLNISNLMIFFGSFVCLAKDRPADALSLVDEAMKMWPTDRFCVQDIRAVYARAEVHLYMRDYRAATQSTEKLWRVFARSNCRHMEVMRILITEFRGRCALCRFETDNGRDAERIARQVIRKLDREKVTWARPMAQRVRANLELKKQNFEAAKVSLRAARDGFEQCNMQLYKNTAEAKLCEITGQLQTERFQGVLDWFSSQQIKNPQAFIEMHYPTGDRVANEMPMRCHKSTPKRMEKSDR